MTIEQTTDFKQQFRGALEQGADYTRLKPLLHRYYEAGGSQPEAYNLLQDLWLEYGYDEDEHLETDTKRDELEFLMERVWYWGE